MNMVVNMVARRFLSTGLLTLALLGAAGCGQESSQESLNSAAVEPAPGTGSAEPAAAPDAAAAAQDQSAAIDPAEAVGEIEEESAGETVEQPAASSVQPSLRLGGPASTPASSQFKEGKNYQRLVPAQPTNVAPDKVEVVEVFWYGCGHCFALDPAIESWREKSKPAYVEFVRVPAMWNDTLRMHARLFYTAELLGKLEELHTPIFRAMHVEGNPLNTADRIAEFFGKHGVSAEEFRKAFASFAVETKLQRADVLNRRYRVQSVPMVVINGKYTSDVSSAGGEQQLFTLIEELSAHERGG